MKVRIRICIKVKSRIRTRICIKVKSIIRIRIRIKSYADPQHWNTETERQETQNGKKISAAGTEVEFIKKKNP